ncbi:pentapeptide repeat-containing protein [Streptomyces hyderabadensis]|uniref:Pentapeptide repeat-containing protein n=1 Tax=Streptomyces hyderabadensis TaxID=598549 RepID=A0ABP9HPF5_9ACTN|nr:pentapeptide repeat-containing protein [Streptomyces hyderabadensis]
MWALSRHVAVVAALGVALFLLTACLVWAALGCPALTGPHALAADKRFDLIKISLSVVAGVGGALALVVAYRRQRIAEAAERREDVRLFNERFVTASSQLGHELPMVRLAGIHALASLADDWPEQRQVCIDVLCAYVRMPYVPSDTPWYHDEETEIRLSLTGIIAAHLREGAPTSWQGHDFDFTRAVLRAADFSGARFSGGRVSFSLVRFTGGWVSFDDAHFSGGRVTFGGTDFAGGRVTFARTTFSGSEISFDGAEFNGAQVSFLGARFTGGLVDLSGADPDRLGTPPEFDAWQTPPPSLMPPATVNSNRPA